MSKKSLKVIREKAPQGCGVTISVLGYQEEGEWAALALEMDLRGYGETFEIALSDLEGLIEMQISFAEFKGQPDMVLHPAAPIYFHLYAQLRDDLLRSLASHHQNCQVEPEYQICGVPVPPAHAIAKYKKGFALANG